LSFCLEKPFRFFLNALRDKESFRHYPARSISPRGRAGKVGTGFPQAAPDKEHPLALARKSAKRFSVPAREHSKAHRAGKAGAGSPQAAPTVNVS
jgi:hypothetical protein